ncbi:MAG TPA: hypothetical protein VFR86_06385 [Burkholderiaceae bacterium]|nr:hypothetical protein [Burkholderiaceae bacterium]
MRRWLLILLAVVLPLKAVAAAVVPITGGWAHAQLPEQAMTHGASAVAGVHAGHAQGAAVESTHAISFAADAAASDATPADTTGTHTIHDHPCPHMGMVSMTGSPAVTPATYAAPELPAEPHARFDSVIHDVPSPPPTPLR